MRVASLCSGYGGLEMGLGMAGINHEPVWYAENDPSASKVMARHHDAPNLGDLTQITVPEPVDLITAGFPCQPFSVAGKREGTEDERWLIDDVCRIARVSGARWLLLENVPGLLTANDGDAMARVCQAMACNGFRRWEWGTVRASDVGACHRRNRWFCIAATHTEDDGHERLRSARGRGHGSADDDRPLADADDPGRQQQRRTVTTLTEHAAVEHGRNAPADADGSTVREEQVPVTRCGDTLVAGLHPQTLDRFGSYADAVARWELTLGRPAPDSTTDGRLAPPFVEWMMGLPAGHVTDTPGLSRAQQLHILGNGVVPQQAAAAIQLLGGFQ